MYVMTSARNVYKCLSNNNSALSTVEPTGDYTSSNGNIATSDGYIWKYMYNITINAGAGSDPYSVGRAVTSAVDKYSRISSAAKQRVTL